MDYFDILLAKKLKGEGGSKTAMLASSGNQMIELPLYSDDTFVIKFKLMMQTIQGTGPIIGDIWDVSSFCLYTEGSIYFRYSTGSPQPFTLIPWEAVDVEMDYKNGTCKYGDTVKGSSNRNSYHRTIKLFGCLENMNRFSTVAIGEVKVIKDENVIMHLIPKKDPTTGEGYYYDEIGKAEYRSTTNTPLKYIEY